MEGVRKYMELQLGNEQKIESPTEEDIRSGISRVAFAILGPKPETYIQCAKRSRSAPGEYMLEYQDGSLKEHHRAIDRPITLERVAAAFCKYAKNDESWKADFQWENIPC